MTRNTACVPLPGCDTPLPARGTFTVINPAGVIILARLLPIGARYGRSHALRNNGPFARIEFFDTRYAFDADMDGVVLGQFISRYCVSEFLACEAGLDLEGGVADWVLDADNVRMLKRWLCVLGVSRPELPTASGTGSGVPGLALAF